MDKTDLTALYREYIACLNRQDWSALGRWVDEDVRYNGRRVGLSGYRAMLEKDFREIPDLQFHVHLLVADASTLASRLDFACTPAGEFMGLPVEGRRVTFSENVFYEFQDGRIRAVWSVIDKAAIEAQL